MDKKIVIPAIFAALILFALFFFFFIQAENNFSGENFLDNNSNENSQNQLVLQRSSYGVSSGVFSELPSPPNDFNVIVSLFHNGGFRDEFFFSEKYFLQPEFYPSFLETGLPQWTNPSTTHYAAYGYGSYPLRKTIYLKSGETAKTKFFFHSGYGVRSYQGVKLVIEPENNGAKSFFAAKVSPNVFLLEPNFPKFEKNWAKGIEIIVDSQTETPSGSYKFFVKVVNPEKELSDKWKNEVIGKYFDAGFVSANKPVFELEIIVD
ncbi:MAG TPA: hypothetical protein VFF13_03165 [archaeon]|nr:hypothetical protein [archaeon]